MDEGTITRKMDAALNSLDKQFAALYEKKDFDRRLRELREAEGKSARPSVLALLYEMLDTCNILYEKGRETDYYENLVKASVIPELSNVEDRMLLALFDKYSEYPSPDAYMQRIVDRLSSPEDRWKGDTLRVRILKQFIKYGRYMEYKDGDGKAVVLVGGKRVIQSYVKTKLGKTKVPSEEEVLCSLDDGIFLMFEQELAEARSREDELKDAKPAEKRKVREQIKALGKLRGKYGLLKLADDLAGGKFRTAGNTKRCLYWFAMVYSMTYYSGKEGQVFESQSDIEKNLFQDYYTNNLMRFITDAYKGRLCEYEIDPSGQGINYKNFAEVIYLYFIAGDDLPQEKIRRSEEMINRVQKGCSGQECGNQREVQQETVLFRNYFRTDERIFQEDVLNLPEQEFERFIRENYDCSTYIRENGEIGTSLRKVGELQVEGEQKTAFRNYQAILEKLRKKMELECCNYGLWFADVSVFQKKGYETLCDRRPEIDRKKFEEFLELLLGVNSFVGNTVFEEISDVSYELEHKEVSRMKLKALFVKGPEDITRTSMLVAYYYYYNAQHENDEAKSFGEVFRSFKKGADEILTQSYYQPLSGKNIFDVMVAFSSYAYLNI